MPQKTRQYATSPDTSPSNSPKDTQYIESVTGSFLYYGQSLDNTILLVLNKIVSEQSRPTESTRNKAQQLMDYATTYPDTYIRSHASNMIPNIYTDDSYLVAPKAKSRVADIFNYLSSQV